MRLHLKMDAAALYIEGTTFPMEGGNVESTGEVE